MPNGRVAKGTRRTTLFVRGSIRTTRARTRSVVQTEPAAESPVPDCGPTETLAMGATGAGAAEAQTANAAASAPDARQYFVMWRLPPTLVQPCSKNTTSLY